MHPEYSESRLFVLLEDLERRVGQLLEQSAQQKKRIKDLEDDLKQQRDQAKQQTSKTAAGTLPFTKSKDFSKLVSSNLPDAVAREEVKQQLDAYIRDLDRCIAHLSALS